MASRGFYIIVGENIHCTRVRMTSGNFVETDASGKSFLVFKDEGRAARLPVPELFTSSDDWKNGKIRHVAAAIHQGMCGSGEERAAGERYLAAMAREQEAAGAWFLDVNVDEYSLELDEKIAAIEWIVALIQRHASVPRASTPPTRTSSRQGSPSAINPGESPSSTRSRSNARQ